MKELSLENYLLSLISKREKDLKLLKANEKDYSKKDYEILFHRYTGSISDMQMALTAFSNPLNQFQ
jgi:hypothetical protein